LPPQTHLSIRIRFARRVEMREVEVLERIERLDFDGEAFYQK
jgi:hypothetical protein